MPINTDALHAQRDAFLEAYAKRHGVAAMVVLVERQVRKALIRELLQRFAFLPTVDKETALSTLRSFEDF
mgnify:CR=1 FL=1